MKWTRVHYQTGEICEAFYPHNYKSKNFTIINNQWSRARTLDWTLMFAGKCLGTYKTLKEAKAAADRYAKGLNI